MNQPAPKAIASRLIASAVCFWVLCMQYVHAQNPLNLGSNILTADPSAHVWNDGRMYLYTSHDQECQLDFHMQDWHTFSSNDLVNWVDHGPSLSLKDISWADNYAWAPDAAYKNGKYYFIFPAGTGFKDRKNPKNSTKWMGIGVAVSDSPTGPFKDAIGAPLWQQPYANDPSLFIDDDGQAYLYVHAKNHDYSVIEMADDLLSTKTDFQKMDMGGYEPQMEGPWVFKRKGIYYYTMPENNRALSYYTSQSPKGPWKYQGIFMEQEGESNNHHSIVEFKGQWVLFYHRWLDTNSDCRKKQRHSAAEYLYFNEDGTIQPVTRTLKGVGTGASNTKATSQPEFKAVLNGYSQSWSVRAPARRLETLKKIWATDGTHQNKHVKTVGLKALNREIQRFTQQFPNATVELRDIRQTGHSAVGGFSVKDGSGRMLSNSLLYFELNDEGKLARVLEFK